MDLCFFIENLSCRIALLSSVFSTFKTTIKMKTLTSIIIMAGIFAGCSKDLNESPDRSATGILGKKSNGLAIALYKEGVLLDVAETNFLPNPIDGALETFDKDISISFYESGIFWQVNNVSKHKPDSLFVSIIHKEQAWCSHCSYYNGNYSLIVESKFAGQLVDRVSGVVKPIPKKKLLIYNYEVTDDSEQSNRFVVVVK